MKDKIVFEAVLPFEPEELAKVTGVPDNITRGALAKLQRRCAIGTEDTLTAIMLMELPEPDKLKDTGLFRWKNHYLFVVDGEDGKRKARVLHYPDIPERTARWVASVLYHMQLCADPDRKNELAEYNKKIGMRDGPLFDFDEEGNATPRFPIPGGE